MIKSTICVFTFSILITGCSLKPTAKGDLQTIYVFADPQIVKDCGLYLSNALERIIRTPQPEKQYYLQYIQWKNFADSISHPNLIMMGIMQDSGEVSRYLQGMLDEKTKRGVENSVYWIFAKRDPWRKGQNLCILCANDAGELSSRLQFGGDELYTVINEFALLELKNQLYSKMERTDIAEDLHKKYGFSLRVQKDYYLVRESAEDRIVRLRRCHPDRFLTISWTQADSLTDSSIVSERLRLNGLFPDPVKIYSEHNRFQEYERGFPSGRMLRGLWGLTSNLGGGPFFTIAFKDDISGKIYFLDGVVFAPGNEKLPFLQQLEVMARTFIVNSQ